MRPPGRFMKYNETVTLINPTLFDMALVGLLFTLVLALSVRERLGLEKQLIIGSLRTVIQLFLVGYIIEYIFHLNRWYIVLFALSFMVMVAAQTASARQKKKIKGLYLLMGFSIFTGTLITTFIVSFIVLKIDPWYNPMYLVPLAGMIIGNSMNGGAIAGERFYCELQSRLDQVETLLILGHDYRYACEQAKREAVKAAMIPTLNSMMTVGLVTLPGMMTGQILAGADPILATKYQIIVMLMVASTVTITSVIFVNLSMHRYFAKGQRLKKYLLREN